MPSAKPITIIGGGLAGLTLGIGLRQRGIPATVWEAGHYPRHRVCGEFISGRGQQVLDRLELRNEFQRAGAVQSQTVAFFANQNSSPVRKLSEPALCLSRHEMDALLAKEFVRLGGELRDNTRWPGSAGILAASDREIRTRRQDASAPSRGETGFQSEGVIRATGRRSRPTENGWRWFGLKIHARGLELKADLEMHALPHGYLGLGITSGNAVNVCGLFRRGANDEITGPIGIETLRGPVGTELRERLAQAHFDENSFCSVAGIALRPQRASDRKECCIGDAVTMIPPVTGNGMSMAFESAEIAIEPLVNFSRGTISWEQARQKVARDCDTAFSQRLAWARFLQWLMFAVAPRPLLGSLTLRSDWLWRMMFAKTR